MREHTPMLHKCQLSTIHQWGPPVNQLRFITLGLIHETSSPCRPLALPILVVNNDKHYHFCLHFELNIINNNIFGGNIASLPASPNPPPQASACVYQRGGGGHTRLRVREWGESQVERLEKEPSTLWYIRTASLATPEKCYG